MENVYYVYPQVDPKVAFPRKAQPKVSTSLQMLSIAQLGMLYQTTKF